MNKNMIINLILLFISIALLVFYLIYMFMCERKTWKQKEFFKYTIFYESEYSLYFKMVKKMRRIIFKKKLELFYLNILLFFRRFN